MLNTDIFALIPLVNLKRSSTAYNVGSSPPSRFNYLPMRLANRSVFPDNRSGDAASPLPRLSDGADNAVYNHFCRSLRSATYRLVWLSNGYSGGKEGD